MNTSCSMLKVRAPSASEITRIWTGDGASATISEDIAILLFWVDLAQWCQGRCPARVMGITFLRRITKHSWASARPTFSEALYEGLSEIRVLRRNGPFTYYLGQRGLASRRVSIRKFVKGGHADVFTPTISYWQRCNRSRPVEPARECATSEAADR